MVRKQLREARPNRQAALAALECDLDGHPGRPPRCPAHMTSRVSRGPHPGAGVVSIHPQQNLLDGQVWRVTHVPSVAACEEQFGERGAARQSAVSDGQRTIHRRPRLTRNPLDLAVVHVRPTSVPVVKRIRPPKNLLDRQGWLSPGIDGELRHRHRSTTCSRTVSAGVSPDSSQGIRPVRAQPPPCQSCSSGRTSWQQPRSRASFDKPAVVTSARTSGVME